jgi:hypothetical protein
MKKPVTGLLVLAASVAVASPLQAIELTYILEGTITQKNDPSGLVDMLAVGDKVVYTVLVDSETPNLTPTPGLGRYDALASDLQIASNVYDTRATHVDIVANGSLSPQSYFNIPIRTMFSDSPANGYFRLTDLDKQAIPSPLLPTVPYDFAPFEWRTLSLTINNPDVYGDYSRVSGTFDSLTIIPEPASLGLLVLASAFWLRRRDRLARTNRSRQAFGGK